jgi:hypothetical protein
MLARQITNQAVRGGWKDAEKRAMGGPYWDKEAWHDYCDRSLSMATNGCGDPSASNEAINQAKPIFIR